MRGKKKGESGKRFSLWFGKNGERGEEGKGGKIGKVEKEGVLMDLEVGDIRGRVRTGEAGFLTQHFNNDFLWVIVLELIIGIVPSVKKRGGRYE